MRWRQAGAAAVVAVPFVALLGFGLTRDPREIPSPLPGRAAPTFALAPIARPAAGVPDTVALARYRGDVVVLNFWASWCLACRDEHAALSAVAAEQGPRGAHFLGVVYKDSPENARSWIDAMGGQSYPSLADPGSRVAIDYGLYGVPETFFIAPDGRVAYKHVGPVTEELLRAKIAEAARPAPGSTP